MLPLPANRTLSLDLYIDDQKMDHNFCDVTGSAASKIVPVFSNVGPEGAEEILFSKPLSPGSPFCTLIIPVCISLRPEMIQCLRSCCFTGKKA